jgi:Uma2 family endonuclease
MNLIPTGPVPAGIVYPESDGQPMADNTRQLQWIVVIYGNLSALFHAQPDVFVAANLLVYPVEDEPEIKNAPDVFVVFGRPRGHRSSYRQWEEGGVPVTVAFEVLSPSNTVPEMADKFAFYEDYGVEEYYIYDPDNNRLQAHVRRGEVLARVRKVDSYVSRRLGIRFDLSGPEMVVFYPDGRRFLSFEELEAERQRERQDRLAAEQRAEVAEREAIQARREAGQARDRMARLRELSRKAREQQASPEELQELERLEDEAIR